VLRVALKSLLGRKLRLLMSTFAIVLGVAFVAGSFIFSDTLSRSFTALFASAVGDVVVSPKAADSNDGFGSSVTLPARLVSRLEQAPGAARVDGNVSAIGVYVVGRGNKLIGGQGAPGLGGSWSDAPAGHGLEGLSITSGREPRGVDEVVVDADTARKAGYHVGDRIHVVSAGAQPVLHPTLVGIAGFRNGGSLNGASLVSWDVPSAQKLFMDGRDVYSDIWVTAKDGVSQTDLRDQVRELLPPGVRARTGDQTAEDTGSDLQKAIGFIQTFLLIFAGISLVVGAFLIVNTFSILVAQRSRELALLRALGASRRQVSRSVLLEAFVLGVLGSTLGLLLGVVLAMAIRGLFARFGLDLGGQSLVFAPRTVLVSYVVGVLVTMAAAFLPARRTSRIAPVQAMRDDVAMPETSLHRRLLLGVLMVAVGGAAMVAGLFLDVPHAGWLVGGGILLVLLGVAAMSPVISRPFLAVAHRGYAAVFGTVGGLAGLNALRNPRRTAATASALMIGLALAGTMAILGSSAKASVDKTIAENFVGDYLISNVFSQPFSPAIADQVAEVPGVQTVVRQRFVFPRVKGDTEFVGGADPSTLRAAVRLEMVKGSLDDWKDGTLMLSDTYAADHDLRIGSSITMGTPKGSRRYPVVAVYADNPVVGAGVLTTNRTLTRAGFADQDNALIVVDEPGATGVRRQLDRIVADLPIVTVKDQAGYAAEQRGPIDQLVMMIYALLGLALVIAVLGIVNTLALSIIERTREVGLLRAIGLGRRQLRRMVTLESVVISALGGLLGVAMGVVFGLAMMYAVRDQGLDVIDVPWGQLTVFLVLALLIGVLAAVLPARRAARLDVLRAIATE
jgi:putative ABC transport system permease protein